MATRHIVGLDIGSKFVKALQLSETSGKYSITEFGISEIPPQVSVTDVVNELFGRKNFRTKRVVSAVSGRFVFVRYISMPVMTDEELTNAAKYELGKYIPVEVDEVLHDSQKLEELPPTEGQEPEMRVLLVAAKRTFIDEHVAVVETAGLQPAIVDVDSFALGNAYELSGMVNPAAVAQGKLVALVDIGASKTNINIMSDSVSYFTREFYKGGDDLTDAVSKKLSLESREAENLKRTIASGSYSPSSGGGGRGGDESSDGGSMPIVMVEEEDASKLQTDTWMKKRDKPQTDVPIVMLEKGDTGRYQGGGGGGAGSADAGRVQEATGSVVEDICHDINISIDYFENQYDKKVEEVYITGGASNTPGLAETLERTVQKPVSRWNPIQHVETDLPKDSAQELLDFPAQAAIAFGLASRLLG
ncbi:MAG TPA: type IV pilus assembly protein PilM [Planctomycetota bacterium]